MSKWLPIEWWERNDLVLVHATLQPHKPPPPPPPPPQKYKTPKLFTRPQGSPDTALHQDEAPSSVQ